MSSIARPRISPPIAVVVTAALSLATSAALVGQPSEDRIAQRNSSGWPDEALTSPTVGVAPSPQTVTAPSSFSLNLDGALELGGYVFQDGIPFLHNDGGATGYNTALGLYALVSTTPGMPFPEAGRGNSAFGFEALRSNTNGYSNTALGYRALYSNGSGLKNTAIGVQAMFANSLGRWNTAIGYEALDSTTLGDRNTAVGYQALADTSTLANGNTAVGHRALRSNTGASNTAVGDSAGSNWTSGSSNIAIGSGAFGVAGESGTIRIGGGNNQNTTFIEGIFGENVTGAAVYVDSDNQLGLTSSSARFKQEIHNIEGVSGRLQDLRPVSFRYKDQVAKGSENPRAYGLIAEEVAKVFPELVINDEQGRPYTVRYSLLTPLLLAEIQRQEGELERLWGVVEELAELRKVVAEQQRRLDRLARGNP